MRVLVAIVNYRSAALTIDCLRSLAGEVAQSPTLRVVVADNHSPDDSVQAIAQAIEANGWSSWASVQPLPDNGGFAYGNNAVIRDALEQSQTVDAVLLLNPDTIVRPGAIAAMSRFMHDHPEAGIVGCRLEDPDGTPHCTAHRCPSPLGELVESARLGIISRWLASRVVSPPVSDEPHACEWLSAASLLIRREVFEHVGLMDEGFFLYFEEVDFCRRAVDAGWQAWYLPSAHVVHLEGQITAVNRTDRPRPRYWFDSRRRFFVKHHGVWGLIVADMFWLAGRTSLMLRRALRLGGSMLGDPRRLTWDIVRSDIRSLFDGSAWRIARECTGK